MLPILDCKYVGCTRQDTPPTRREWHSCRMNFQNLEQERLLILLVVCVLFRYNHRIECQQHCIYRLWSGHLMSGWLNPLCQESQSLAFHEKPLTRGCKICLPLGLVSPRLSPAWFCSGLEPRKPARKQTSHAQNQYEPILNVKFKKIG